MLEIDDNEFEELNGSSKASKYSWRIGLIEKALNSVKEARKRPFDQNLVYPADTLIFDKDKQKYARVLESREGYLKIGYISGETNIKQTVEPLDFIAKNRTSMTLLELAKHLKISEVQVVAYLNELETFSAEPKSTPKVIAKSHKALEKTKNKVFIKKPTASVEKTKVKVSGKLAENASMDSFEDILPQGATTDPIMDPNGYIKQTFMLMNNRQIAAATGLSEHTIRRKLGEWGLKRK